MSEFVIGQTDDISKYYDLGSRIGQAGQFGHAITAVCKNTGENRAVKVINKLRFARDEREEYFDQFRAEIEIMRQMDHPNIIKFYDVYETKSELYIVMELCTGGELFDRIKEQGSYSENDASNALRMMMQGISYMHEKKIAHCDLKPDNFLYASDAPDAQIKIIDFGMSKFVKRRKYFRSLCGTPYYVAPEVIKAQYNESADIWSMGVVMFVMLFGYPPFYADPSSGSAREVDEAIFRLVLQGFSPIVKNGYAAHFPADIKCSASAKNLLSKLLKADVALRPTADEALAHPWLTGRTASMKPISDAVLKNLLQFSAKTHFKAKCLELMTDQLSDHEIKDLEKCFREMDANNDGVVTISEMQVALEKSGKQLSKDMVQKIVEAADLDNDGKVSYKELVLKAVQRKLVAKEERLLKAFKRLDQNGDGKVTKEELKDVFTNEKIDDLLEEADADGDGKIDYEEFLSIWYDKNA